MTNIENIIISLLMWLSSNSGIPVESNIWNTDEYFPKVFFIPQEDLATYACGCSCPVQGVYFKQLFNEKYVIIMGVKDYDGKIPIDEQSNIMFFSVLVHELQHHFQQLNENFVEVKYHDRISRETDAYTIQNKYLKSHGITPPKSFSKNVQLSANTLQPEHYMYNKNSNICFNLRKGNQQFLVETVIKHNQDLITVYDKYRK